MRHLLISTVPAALALSLLAACSSPTSVDPGPREFEITPEQPRIGQRFTVRLRRVIQPPFRATAPTEPGLPDGEFLVFLGATREEPLLSPWPFNWPRPVATPVEPPTIIGSVTVKDGSGENSFELSATYGSFKPEAGKPLQLSFQGPSRSMGTAFVVGGP